MTISVVIPTLNEASHVVPAIESVLAGNVGEGASGVEVVVVDGGSRDATARLAREAGARVFAVDDDAGGPEGRTAEAPRQGRAHQLRFGTEKTDGEILLFLHADTRLEPGWREALEGALANPRVAGGAFRFRFHDSLGEGEGEGNVGAWERWIEGWVAIRVAVLGLPYGDQALFMRRSVLEQMGGVPIVPIMEDLDLVAGIKRAGELARLDVAALTSSRRYRARGAARTIIWHGVALLGWALGWDRARLAARMGR